MLSRGIPVFVLLIAGCTYVPLLTPYKMDIQQGNVITQEMVARLERGMTRAQVRFTLGTPLVVDPFRADRWDYVYLYIKGGAITEQRRIVVVFKDDRLERIEGDVVPAVRARIDKPAPTAGSAQSAQQTER
jgi:outer membrane protein assembly factor BamE